MDNFYIESTRETAEAILSGALDILIGCRRLNHAMACADLHNDPSYQIFNGVTSECDHLPIGQDRKHWNPEVLKRKDIEIARLKDHYRPSVLKACEELVARLRGSEIPPISN